jgi:hypothetical protein
MVRGRKKEEEGRRKKESTFVLLPFFKVGFARSI